MSIWFNFICFLGALRAETGGFFLCCLSCPTSLQAFEISTWSFVGSPLVLYFSPCAGIWYLLPPDPLYVDLESKAHSAPSLSPQVILKDLELLAEIASSPAGQTEEGHGPSDGSDVRPGPVELHVPARAGQLSSSSECPCATAPCLSAPGLSPCSMAPVRFAQAKGEASFTVINQCIQPHPAEFGD